MPVPPFFIAENDAEWAGARSPPLRDRAFGPRRRSRIERGGIERRGNSVDGGQLAGGRTATQAADCIAYREQPRHGARVSGQRRHRPKCRFAAEGGLAANAVGEGIEQIGGRARIDGLTHIDIFQRRLECAPLARIGVALGAGNQCHRRHGGTQQRPVASPLRLPEKIFGAPVELVQQGFPQGSWISPVRIRINPPVFVPWEGLPTPHPTIKFNSDCQYAGILS